MCSIGSIGKNRDMESTLCPVGCLPEFLLKTLSKGIKFPRWRLKLENFELKLGLRDLKWTFRSLKCSILLSNDHFESSF